MTVQCILVKWVHPHCSRNSAATHNNIWFIKTIKMYFFSEVKFKIEIKSCWSTILFWGEICFKCAFLESISVFSLEKIHLDTAEYVPHVNEEFERATCFGIENISALLLKKKGGGGLPKVPTNSKVSDVPKKIIKTNFTLIHKNSWVSTLTHTCRLPPGQSETQMQRSTKEKHVSLVWHLRQERKVCEQEHWLGGEPVWVSC